MLCRLASFECYFIRTEASQHELSEIAKNVRIMVGRLSNGKNNSFLGESCSTEIPCISVSYKEHFRFSPQFLLITDNGKKSRTLYHCHCFCAKWQYHASHVGKVTGSIEKEIRFSTTLGCFNRKRMTLSRELSMKEWSLIFLASFQEEFHRWFHRKSFDLVFRKKWGVWFLRNEDCNLTWYCKIHWRVPVRDDV